MGLVRLFLAIAVALSHKPEAYFYGLSPINANAAVEGFFAISGFFIAMVLCENPAYSGERRFYTSRYLRLWPTYAICSLFTLIAVPDIRATLSQSPLALFTAFTIFLQDVPHFLPQYFDYGGAFIPQAWSLGVELWFYLIAPFTLRRFRTAALFVVVGLLTRVLLVSNGLVNEPWSTRFAPAEALYFGLGACAYHASRRLDAVPPIVLKIVGAIAACVVLFCVADRGRVAAVWGLPIVDWSPLLLRDVWFQALLVVAVPFIFRAAAGSRIDSFLGQLSYPVYLLVFGIGFLLVGQPWPHLNLIFLALLMVAGTSVLILVDWPIERVRQFYVKRLPDDRSSESLALLQVVDRRSSSA